MLYYDRIEACEGIVVNKTNVLKECNILNIKSSDYHYIISLVSKNEAIKLMQNADLTGKSGVL